MYIVGIHGNTYYNNIYIIVMYVRVLVGGKKSVCIMYVYVCFEILRGFISWSHTLGFSYCISPTDQLGFSYYHEYM